MVHGPGRAGRRPHGLDELVEGEVLGSLHVHALATEGGVGHGEVDDARDVSCRDEVDRVLTAPEDPGAAGRHEWPSDDLEPGLLVRSRSDHGPGQAAGPEPLLGGSLHPEELDGMVGGRLLDRHQDEVFDAGRFRRVDEVDVAVAIDGLHAECSVASEAIDRRDDSPHPDHRAPKRLRVPDVADRRLDPRQREVRTRPASTGEDPDRFAMAGEERDERAAEHPRSARDQDHRCTACAIDASPVTIRRTASPAAGPPSSTGSM